MLHKLEYKNSNNTGSDSNNGQLLRDIEEISKALYLHRTPTGNARSKSAGKARLSESKSSLNRRLVREDSLTKGKKSSSVWNWKKPLKALAHIGYKKFHCQFYLHAHSIEGLNANFDHLSLCVRWKRKNEVVQTSPSKVSRGVAEFEETLINQCSVYGSIGGPNHPVKYESKLFLIYASVVEAPDLDIGKQWVDLTSFLPRTLEELEGEKSRGQWNTSFNLSGKAKGASLNVSFGFWVMRDKAANSSSCSEFPEILNMVQKRSSPESGFGFGSSNRNRVISRVAGIPYGSGLLRQSLDVKVCREVLMRTGLELSNSINCLYQKLDEGNSCTSDESDSHQPEKHKAKLDLDFISAEEIEGYDWDITELSITEVGTEISESEHLRADQAADHSTDGLATKRISVDEISKDDYFDFDKIMMSFPKDDDRSNSKSEDVMVVLKAEVHNNCVKGLSIEELDSACDSQTSESSDLNAPTGSSVYVEQKNHMDAKANYKRNRSVKGSLSLDAVAETVASDFFNMLGLGSGSFRASSDYDPESPREILLRQFEEETLASGHFVFDFDTKHEESQSSCSIVPGFICGDGSEESELSLIIYDAEEEQKRVSGLLKRRNAKFIEDLETEALMREWGLNEEDFQNSPHAYSGGFGSPIELPPEEQRPLPPLEEGFGPFVQMKNGGFLWSMSPSLFRNAKNGGNLIIQVSNPAVLPAKMGYHIMEIIQNMALVGSENLYKRINKLVPLEDIMGKRIKQVASNAAPSLIPTQRKVTQQHHPYFDGIPLEFVSLEDLSPMIVNKVEGLFLEGLKIQSRMSGEETPSCIIPQSTGKTSASESTSKTITSSDLVSLLTLDEWLMLDSGNTGNKDHDSDWFLKTLVAHHAKCIDSDFQNWLEASGKKCGLLGNDLTIAHLVQLLNPHRNYEPVGAPMILLIQVQRKFSGASNENPKDEASYRVTGAHVAGVNTSRPEKLLWGTASQQQSGTRWLLGSGVARTVTGCASKSKAIAIPSPLGLVRSLPGDDVLWSVSSNVCDVGVSWEHLAMASHTRNPDVVFV